MGTNEDPPTGNGVAPTAAGQVVTDLTEPVVPAVRPEPRFGRPKHFCTDCGEPLLADDAFCASCGMGTGRAVVPHPSAAAQVAAPPTVGATVPAAPAPQAVAPPPAPPVRPATPPATPSSDGSGRPAWLLPALAGFGAVVAIVAVVGGGMLLLGGDDGDGGGSGASSTPAAGNGAYLTRITPDYGQLTRSATTMGNALSVAAAAKDVATINATARRQLQAATDAYNALAAMPVTASDRGAQTALVAAAAAQRRYLAAVARATSVEPSAGLRQVAAVGKAGRDTVAAYRRFIALAPGAATAITSAGLADTGGLAAALRAKGAFLARQNAPAPGRVVPSGPLADGTGFMSPAGTTVCAAYGGSVVCSSAAGTVAIDQSGPAYYAGSGPSGGYGTLPYGTTWRSGSIWCEISSSYGTHCQNPDHGQGFFYIRAQDIRLG